MEDVCRTAVWFAHCDTSAIKRTRQRHKPDHVVQGAACCSKTSACQGLPQGTAGTLQKHVQEKTYRTGLHQAFREVIGPAQCTNFHRTKLQTICRAWLTSGFAEKKTPNINEARWQDACAPLLDRASHVPENLRNNFRKMGSNCMDAHVIWQYST